MLKWTFGPFEETIEITGNHGSFIRVVQLKTDRSEAVFSYGESRTSFFHVTCRAPFSVIPRAQGTVSEDNMPSKKDAKKFMRSMSERAALALEKKLAGVDPRSPWARYFPNDFLEDENKVDDPRILANAQTLDSLGRVVTGA